MCVIFVVDDEKTRPEEDHIRAAFQSNDDGAGAAWRQDGMVAWRRGLDQAQMIELNQSLPVPYVLHFRIASCGGIKSELTHPFEIGIQEDGSLLEGLTANPVLFHNGHWGDWQRELKDAVYKSRLTLPAGPWSDTRAMAWIVEKFGPGMLEFIPTSNRLVYFTPTGDFPLYGDFDKSGNGWSYYRGEFLCSNTHWTYKMAKSYFQTPPASMGGGHNCSADNPPFEDDTHPAVILAPETKLLPGVRSEEVRTLLEKPFRGSGGNVQGEDNQQESLEEVQKSSGPAVGPGVEGSVEAGGSGPAREEANGGSPAPSGRDTGTHSGPLMSTADKMAVVELARRQAMEQEEARWARSLQPKVRQHGMTADQRERQRNQDLRQALADAGRRL